MTEEQKTWTLDDRARASNPGDLHVDFVHWFRQYPKWPSIWLGGLVLFVVLANRTHWAFWLLALVLLGMNWLYWRRIQDHFRHGDANPALVVSSGPMLIAVATDLSKDVDGRYPALKIFQKQLPALDGHEVRIGTRIATVSLYSPSPDDVPYWSDFDPRPVNCATRDLGDIQAILQRFPGEDWQHLERMIEAAPKPLAPGLYEMWVDNGEECAN
ncbi:MAG: DUF3239 domain-containing protein [Planctomycetota bacterium]